MLTYLVGQPEKLAITSSLAIVGAISFIAVLPYAFRREVDWDSVAWFGLPGVLGTWLGAIVAQYLPSALQLTVFAAIMLFAAWRMIAQGGSKAAVLHVYPPPSKLQLVRTGLMVGAATGIVGVGGGFLIVPALILLVGLSMRRAIGTSLVVIAANAFSGFIQYAGGLKALDLALDWRVIAVFIALGGIGTVLGHAIGARLPQHRLKQSFGGLLVVMSVYMLIIETPKLFTGITPWTF